MYYRRIKKKIKLKLWKVQYDLQFMPLKYLHALCVLVQKKMCYHSKNQSDKRKPFKYQVACDNGQGGGSHLTTATLGTTKYVL